MPKVLGVVALLVILALSNVTYSTSMPKTYALVQDDDSHWYVIPTAKGDDWGVFLDLPKDDERSWSPPKWAVPVNGAPNRVHFEKWVIE